MNAVNLIPDAASGAKRRLSTSPQTLALIAGLAAVLVAALLYVSAVNNVTARNSELVRATANAATWQTVANAFAPYISASAQRTAQLTAVRQLAAGRFRWSHLLDQIAQVMPAAATLSSLQASLAASSGTSTPTSTQPIVQLAGCAASQSTVAYAMDQLRRVDGVSDVELSSSSDSGAGTAATGSAPTGTGCTVLFQLSLTLSTASTGAATASSTNPTATTSTSATPATSTSTTPTTSTNPTATTSTGTTPATSTKATAQ